MSAASRRRVLPVAAAAVITMLTAQTVAAAQLQPDDSPVVAAHHRSWHDGGGWGGGDQDNDGGWDDDADGGWDDDGGWDNDSDRHGSEEDDKHEDGSGGSQDSTDDGWNRGREGDWRDIVGFAANNGRSGGYWVLTKSGHIFALSGAPELGSVPEGRRYISMTSHPSKTGFWVLTDRGTVHAFGKARHLGSASFRAIGMAVPRTGRGYWIASRNGTVKAFGKARHHGGARRLNVQVDRIASREEAEGYYLRTTTGKWLVYPRPKQERRDRDRPTRSEPRKDPAPTVSKPRTTGGVTVVTVSGITVAKSIADDVRRLMRASVRDGVSLGGWGYRSTARQIELRRAHCGKTRYAIYHMPSSQCSPPTARPGSSMHEQGKAIDFYKSGAGGRAIPIAGTREFRWLKRNAHRYGLYNLPSEPWHWSTNGR